MIDILLDPLVWLAFAIGLTIIFNLIARRCFRCVALSTCTLCLLVLLASPSFANRWIATLEDTYPLRQCDIASNTRPVVVLAGGLGGGYRDFPLEQRLSSYSKNRSLAAVEALADQKLLIIAGGLAPSRREGVAESEAIAVFIRPMLSEDVTVIQESGSANTYESAANIGAIFEQRQLSKELLLVTSAWHMRRSVDVFEQQGFSVCTYAVNPMQNLAVPLSALWPRISALQKTDLALHEWIGWLYYRYKGYL